MTPQQTSEYLKDLYGKQTSKSSLKYCLFVLEAVLKDYDPNKVRAIKYEIKYQKQVLEKLQNQKLPTLCNK